MRALLLLFFITSCSSFENPKNWHPSYIKNNKVTPRTIASNPESEPNQITYKKKYSEGMVPIKTYGFDVGMGADLGMFNKTFGAGLTFYYPGSKDVIPFYLGAKIGNRGNYGSANNSKAPSGVSSGNGGYLDKDKGSASRASGIYLGGRVFEYQANHIFLGASYNTVKSCERVWKSSVGYYERCETPKKETKVVPEVKVMNPIFGNPRLPASITINTDKEIMVGLAYFF